METSDSLIIPKNVNRSQNSLLKMRKTRFGYRILEGSLLSTPFCPFGTKNKAKKTIVENYESLCLQLKQLYEISNSFV